MYITYYNIGTPFGTVTLTKENIGATGKLIQIKLQRVMQSTQCDTGTLMPDSRCKETLTPLNEIIGAEITDGESTVLFQQNHRIVKGDATREVLIFQQQQETAPRVPQLPYKLRIWFNQRQQPQQRQYSVDVFAIIMQDEQNSG